MKKLIIATCLLLLSSTAFAVTPGSFGVGLILGDPTGISGKYWIDKDNAIDAAIGFNRFSVHADYLFHLWNIFPQTGAGDFGAYLGPGIVFKDKKHDNIVGIRFALGAVYELNTYPIEFFAEIVPVLELSPDTELNLDGGIGIRYFF